MPEWFNAYKDAEGKPAGDYLGTISQMDAQVPKFQCPFSYLWLNFIAVALSHCLTKYCLSLRLVDFVPCCDNMASQTIQYVVGSHSARTESDIDTLTRAGVLCNCAPPIGIVVHSGQWRASGWFCSNRQPDIQPSFQWTSAMQGIIIRRWHSSSWSFGVAWCH